MLKHFFTEEEKFDMVKYCEENKSKHEVKIVSDKYEYVDCSGILMDVLDYPIVNSMSQNTGPR